MLSHLVAPVMCCFLFAQVEGPIDLLKRPEQREAVQSPAQASSAPIIHILGSFGITGATVQAQAQRIKPNPSNLWGHGYALGRPIQVENVKAAEDLLEISVNEGNLPGPTLTLSASYSEFFQAFTQLDQTRIYLFEYEIPDPSRPELRQLKAIHTPEAFLQARQIKTLPHVMLSGDGRTGLVANGETQGKIARVERVGEGPHCLLQLDSELQADDHTQPITFDITGEQFCVHGETLLALNQDIRLSFAQEVISEPTPYFVSSLEVIVPERQTSNLLEKLTPAQLEDLLKSLEDRLFPRLYERLLRESGDRPK